MPRHKAPKLCYYCRKQLGPASKRGGTLPPRTPTLDHVYPANAKYPPILKQRAEMLGIAPRSSLLNKVVCCSECNSRKGSLHPLVWLTICPSDDGALTLSRLLLSLGEPPHKVEAALLQRTATR